MVAFLALLSHPASAATSARADGEPQQVTAGDAGAVICAKLDPLKVYSDLRGDAEAIKKFLASGEASSCQEMDKGTQLFLMPSVEAGKSFIALRKQGEFTPLYGLASEWRGAITQGSGADASANKADESYIPQIEWGLLTDMVEISNVHRNGDTIEFDVKCKNSRGYILDIIGIGKDTVARFLDKDGIVMAKLGGGSFSFLPKALVLEKKYPRVAYWEAGMPGKGVLLLPTGLALEDVRKIELYYGAYVEVRLRH